MHGTEVSSMKVQRRHLCTFLPCIPKSKKGRGGVMALVMARGQKVLKLSISIFFPN